jgi:hypothetical protein
MEFDFSEASSHAQSDLQVRAPEEGAQRGKLAMINQVLRKLADEKNVFWVDFGHRFLNEDGTLPREGCPTTFTSQSRVTRFGLKRLKTGFRVFLATRV